MGPAGQSWQCPSSVRVPPLEGATGWAHAQQGVCAWHMGESRTGCSRGTACLLLMERQAQWSWARPRCCWAWLHVLAWEPGRGMHVKQCAGSCGRQLAPGGGQDPSGWAHFLAANPCRLAGTARVRVCSQGSEGGNLPSSLLSQPPWRYLQWDCFQWVVLSLLSHCSTWASNSQTLWGSWLCWEGMSTKWAGVNNLHALLSLLSSWGMRSRGVLFPGQAPLTLSVNWLGDKYSRCSHAG